MPGTGDAFAGKQIDMMPGAIDVEMDLLGLIEKDDRLQHLRRTGGVEKTHDKSFFCCFNTC